MKYPEEGVPAGSFLAVACFGLKIDKLPSCIARGIFRALFVDDLAVYFHGRSLDTIETCTTGSKCHTGMGDKKWFQVCSPKVQSRAFHCTPILDSEPPPPPPVRIGNTLLPVEESTKFLGLWWDSHLSFKKHISVLNTKCKEALNLTQVVAHLKWGGDRDTLLMLYRAIIRSKLDLLCMAQHQTPIYDNWTASITLDWDWHWERSAPAQCPACTQRPMKLLWRNVG